MNRYRLYLLIALTCLSNSAKSGNWVDIDGRVTVEFKEKYLSIYSMDNFYYFDQIFTIVRKEKNPLRLCIGPGYVKGRPLDCFENISAIPKIYNEGKNRALHLNIANHQFVIKVIEDKLFNGHQIKISIDDGDLYSAYTLHKNYVMSEEVNKIFAK